MYQISTGIFKEVTIPKSVEPIEQAKQSLTISGYTRLTTGMSIALLSFICSLAFANKISHTITGIGMAIGGYLSLDGLLKIFAAEYLPYLIWGAVFLLIGGIAYRLREKSIVKWFKAKGVL